MDCLLFRFRESVLLGRHLSVFFFKRLYLHTPPLLAYSIYGWFHPVLALYVQWPALFWFVPVLSSG